MLKVSWMIGRKPRGNWHTPFDFKISFEDSEELLLNPKFEFYREYKLPDSIILSKGNGKVGTGNICRRVNILLYNINTYINCVQDRHLKENLNYNACVSTCFDCKAYLPWRSGLPDYSDFEEVFRQVAYDMCDAWNRGVQEALESLEYGQDPVIITSDNYKQAKEEALASKPTRRIKI